MENTTKITTLFDEDSQDLMTDKLYPLYSHYGEPIVDEEQTKKILQILFQLKLNRYYDCIQKAKIVAGCFGHTSIHLGSLMVESTEKGIAYGYYYNPPLELHAWVQIEDKIIDFALAGTIEKGLKTKDHIGYFLVNREPIILAGTPPPWIHYETHEIKLIKDVHQLSYRTAKELINRDKRINLWK